MITKNNCVYVFQLFNIFADIIYNTQIVDPEWNTRAIISDVNNILYFYKHTYTCKTMFIIYKVMINKRHMLEPVYLQNEINVRSMKGW